MSNAATLSAERVGLIRRAREINERAEREGRSLHPEERSTFDRMLGRADELRLRCAEEERRSVWREALLNDRPKTFFSDPRLQEEHRQNSARRSTPQYREKFMAALKVGQAERMSPEFRDTIAVTDSKGGAIAAPTILAAEFMQVLESVVEIIRLATKITMSSDTVAYTPNDGVGKGIAVPFVSVNPADADWTTEVAAVTEDTTMAISIRNLTPHPLSKLAKVSLRFMSAAANADLFVARILGYKFAVTLEKAALVGSGSGQPLGIFVASASGVPTGQDISTGNTTTAIGSQNLFEMKYGLKAAYRNDPTCRWVWSDDAMKSIMLMKDDANRYLWEPSANLGQPDMLLSIPVIESAFCPATFTTGLYVGALGAFRHYAIGEADTLRIQTLVEKYSLSNEIGFIGRHFVDGAPVIGEAFVRSKLA